MDPCQGSDGGPTPPTRSRRFKTKAEETYPLLLCTNKKSATVACIADSAS